MTTRGRNQRKTELSVFFELMAGEGETQKTVFDREPETITAEITLKKGTSSQMSPGLDAKTEGEANQSLRLVPLNP